jgi:cation:H+ antiporter
MTKSPSADRSIRVARATPPLVALLAVVPFAEAAPETALWAAPAILAAAMLIAWAAESAQFFMAQGFALAILALLQTLPEFAVEAVFAWKQQVPLLMANLTGSLRLLTGLGWPMIYFTAAMFYRFRAKKPLNRIVLHQAHSVEVVGLGVPLLYAAFIWWKGSLAPTDAGVLIAIYVAYLMVLSRMPAEDAEGIEDLELIPRKIVTAPRKVRILLIAALFAGGGLLIFFSAEPFAGSLLAVATMLGVSSFVFVQWVAPFVSEFPEKVSAFYWARTVDKAPMALMNMVSSNINQWTLLAAMLPLVYSVSRGAPSAIVFDQQQSLELLMTVGQSLVGMLFLINMQLAWWEAAALFGLWGVQFALSPVSPGPGPLRYVAGHSHAWITAAYLLWFGAGLISNLIRRRKLLAFTEFAALWRRHVRGSRKG